MVDEGAGELQGAMSGRWIFAVLGPLPAAAPLTLRLLCPCTPIEHQLSTIVLAKCLLDVSPPPRSAVSKPIIASPTPPRGEWSVKLLFCFAVCNRLVLEQLAVQGERPSPRGYHTLTTLGPHCVVIGGRTEEGRIQGRQMVAVFDPATW